MADEITQGTEPVEQVQTPQHSPIEQRAMDQGWVPQDEWQGDPDDWRPAKEFVDRGELLKSISELRHENRRIKEGVEEFRKHHAQVKEFAYKQALADLKAQKKTALEEGDADKVVAIDDRIAETREQQKQAEAAPKQAVQNDVPNPDMMRWEARNPWYKQDRVMKAAADEIARELVERGERDVARILVEVDKGMKATFPNKFENPNRAKVPPVEGSTKTTRGASKDEVFMTDSEKAIMKRIVDSKIITKEAYLKEFKARQGG